MPATVKKSKKDKGETHSEGVDSPILIKKYPNRRIYNTATSSYIVLDDVVQMVKDNVNFVIEDAKTGENITRTILNQIIFEQETKPADFHFPLEFQKQLISMYGDTYGQMVPSYLTESLKLLVSERLKMNSAFENVVDRNARAMMDYSQNLARQNMELFRRSWNMFSAMNGESGDANVVNAQEYAQENRNAPDTDGQGTSEKSPELEDIQRQIDALQARLKSLK
jgi:polyhydroxyalkanoate synthesis repressor PhaR